MLIIQPSLMYQVMKTDSKHPCIYYFESTFVLLLFFSNNHKIPDLFKTYELEPLKKKNNQSY